MLTNAVASLDGDGLPDIWEMRQFGTVELATDVSNFDHDPALDIMEYQAGTDPRNPFDYPPGDGDSIDDRWEMQYFGDLTTADETTDWDGDGILDKDEFLAGYNPRQTTTSVLEVVGFRRGPNGQMIIEWPTSAETNPSPRHYVILMGSNLSALVNNPIAIATNIPGDGFDRTATNGVSMPAAYYGIKTYIRP
ncbi:MAG: hypothetical protein V2A34_03485 [Lentisphaerota bacterium]